MAGATRICCHLGAFCVHHTTMHHVTSCKATYVRCTYLALTCHLHFWQNDRGLLRATAVTRGWNVYGNKSQHIKLTLEKKILPPLLQGFEPATFRSLVRRSNHWAIPAIHTTQRNNNKQQQPKTTTRKPDNVYQTLSLFSDYIHTRTHTHTLQIHALLVMGWWKKEESIMCAFPFCCCCFDRWSRGAGIAQW